MKISLQSLLPQPLLCSRCFEEIDPDVEEYVIESPCSPDMKFYHLQCDDVA